MQMRVLSRLDADAARALLATLPAGWSLHNTAGLRELRTEARRLDFDVVVLDPLDVDLTRRDAERVRLTFVSVWRDLGLPIVFLAPMQSEVFVALANIASAAHIEVVFRTPDGPLDALIPTLERAMGTRLAIRIFLVIRDVAASRLSSTSLAAVEQLFDRPSAFRRLGKTLQELGISQALLPSNSSALAYAPSTYCGASHALRTPTNWSSGSISA